MVEACRLEVSIAAQRNRSRDDAPVIQCRAVERRMHHTVLAPVSNLDHKKHIKHSHKRHNRKMCLVPFVAA